jgi:hypothetical protein
MYQIGQGACFKHKPKTNTTSLVAIGPGQICVSNKTDDNFSNKDFPRGQVNGFADNLDQKKLKRGTD